MILTERKEPLETLKSLLEKKIQNLIAMKGGMEKKQHNRISVAYHFRIEILYASFAAKYFDASIKSIETSALAVRETKL